MGSAHWMVTVTFRVKPASNLGSGFVVRVPFAASSARHVHRRSLLVFSAVGVLGLRLRGLGFGGLAVRVETRVLGVWSISKFESKFRNEGSDSV